MPAPRFDRRLRGWPRRLAAWLAAAGTKPWDGIRRHCLEFVAQGVKAQTGKDIMLGRRGRFRSVIGQQRHLRRLGFDSPAALLDDALPSRPVSFARRGDVVMGADGIPGICLGATAAFAGPGGVVTEKAAGMVRAWTVGEA
jgi:hypothetical protein